MKVKAYLVLMLLMMGSFGMYAQHEHHEKADSANVDQHMEHQQHKAGDGSHSEHATVDGPPMTSAYSLNLPMNRNGSGTGWLPDSSPMYGYMVHSKKWMYMFHGNVFLRYTNQDFSSKGARGDAKIDAPNWFMAMGQRRVGKRGLIHFSTMFSLDPVFSNDGYPLLFQTGETYKGRPLVDRQHPHNLFSELSISYSQSFTKDLDAFIYLGYPGEPALGPVAFMHRPSSLNMPDSPLGHHWQDATHITFGVVTAGFRYKLFKVDGSVFTGREPGEKRYGLDKPLLNSYSYRLTVNPTSSLSAQVSRAYLKNPENSEPAEDVRRTTASVNYSLPLTGENSFFTSAFVYGFNDSGEDHKEHSFTVEGNLQLDRLAVYARFENVEKSAEELQVEYDHHELFKINALTAGINYTFLHFKNTNLAFGLQGTIYSADQRLDASYGNNPASVEAYIRVSPGLINIKRQ